jgi:hypothetical protein
MAKPKRKERRVINPLYLVAGVQKIATADAMLFCEKFDDFLFQIERGHGEAEAIRGMTLFIAALYDASVHYKASNVKALIDKTGDLWIRAAERCTAKGMTDRIAINAEEMDTLRTLHEAMRVFLPEVQVGPWKCFMESAQRRWDKFAGQSQAFKNYVEHAA